MVSMEFGVGSVVEGKVTGLTKFGAFVSLPEGVSYSIVLMNIITPLIERYVKPRAFGSPKKKKKEENAA